MNVTAQVHEGLQAAVDDLGAYLQQSGISVVLLHPMPDVANMLTERLGLPVHQISDVHTRPLPGHLVIVDADLVEAWAARQLDALDRPATALVPRDAFLLPVDVPRRLSAALVELPPGPPDRLSNRADEPPRTFGLTRRANRFGQCEGLVNRWLVRKRYG